MEVTHARFAGRMPARMLGWGAGLAAALAATAGLVFALAAPSAMAAETVLEQNWDTASHPLYSEIPAHTVTDPLTGVGDQWLIFSGGQSAFSPSGEKTPGTGSPDTAAEGTPQVNEEVYGANNAAADAHNFWHVQANAQNVCLVPEIFPALVTLAAGDNGCFLGPVSSPNDLSFSQVAGSQSTGFCGANFALNAENANPKSGCNTNPDPSFEPPEGATHGTVEVGSVISPPFSLTGASSAVLHMNSWFDIESVDANIYDVMEVEYTTNLGTKTDKFEWHSLGALNPISNPAGSNDQDNTNNGFLTAPSWDEILVDLQPAIDVGAPGNEHVRVRFVFDTWDNLYNGFRGWNIDNLHVATPFDVPAPAITNVQPCVGNNLNPVTTISGTNFLLHSKVSVDGGTPEAAQTPSSKLIEIPVIEAGTHTLQVVDPNGTVTSNVLTVTQPATCEPSAPPPVVTPGPPIVIPPVGPKEKHPPVVLEEGELEWEVEFPEPGEAEFEAEVLEGAELARVHTPFDALAAKHHAHKCRKGTVKKHGKCVSRAPVRYGKGKLTIATPGAYKLHFKPSPQVLKALKKGKKLNVRLHLVFTPRGTTVHITKTASVKLRFVKSHKHKHGKHGHGKHKK